MIASQPESDLSRHAGGSDSTRSTAGREWWLVVCLTIVSMLAMIDKNLIQLMVTQIKLDIGLTDVQISVLIGAAFAVANMLAGLPAGWLADRISRRGIVITGVIVWSLATSTSGLVTTYMGLFLARATIGLGEGVIPPAAYSLLRDGVATVRRARALALYSAATTAGAGIALVTVGALIGFITSHGIESIPVVGAIRPWQLALVLIGLAGLPVGLLLVSLPKVERQHSQAAVSTTSFGDAIRFMTERRRVFVPLIVYGLMHSMMMATMGSWVPALIGRKFGLPPQQLGAILGSMLIVLGPGGLMIVGWAIDRLQSRGLPSAPVVAFAGSLILAGAAVAMPQIETLALFWPIEAIVVAVTTPFLVVTSVVAAQETPPQMLGKVMAIILFLQALVGPACAPTIAALFSDHVYVGSPNALGNAISTVAAVYGSIGTVMAFVLWRAMRHGRS